MTPRRPSMLGLPSLLEKRELLGSIPNPDTGLICACYPTGNTTLCGWATSGGEPAGPAPTCPVCVRVAQVWDSIDGSVPPAWGWTVAAA